MAGKILSGSNNINGIWWGNTQIIKAILNGSTLYETTPAVGYTVIAEISNPDNEYIGVNVNGVSQTISSGTHTYTWTDVRTFYFATSGTCTFSNVTGSFPSSGLSIDVTYTITEDSDFTVTVRS